MRHAAGTRLTLERVLLGTGVVGEKYLLANIGKSDLVLAERDLFRPGVMAVSIEHASLRPGESTDLFIVRERSANE